MIPCPHCKEILILHSEDCLRPSGTRGEGEDYSGAMNKKQKKWLLKLAEEQHPLAKIVREHYPNGVPFFPEKESVTERLAETARDLAIYYGERYRKSYELCKSNGWDVGRSHVDNGEAFREAAQMARDVLQGFTPVDAYEAARKRLQETMRASASRVKDFALRPSEEHGQDILQSVLSRLQSVL